MVQRAEKFANDEKWRERSCYGREAFIWWKTRENTTVIIVETRSNDEKRWKTPRLLLKRSVRVMKSAGKHHCYCWDALKWWKALENTTVIIEEKRSSDEKRGKSEKDSARKAHEDRQKKFDQFGLVPHRLKFVNLFWRISSTLRNDLSLQGRKPA